MSIQGEGEADLKTGKGPELAVELILKEIQQHSSQSCVWAGVFPSRQNTGTP